MSAAQPRTPACRVCGSSATIEAHLFPRALAHDIRGHHKQLFVGAASTPGRRIVQAGLFDRGILCSAHEAALGLYDDYGIDFCRNFKTSCHHLAPNIWQVSPWMATSWPDFG